MNFVNSLREFESRFFFIWDFDEMVVLVKILILVWRNFVVGDLVELSLDFIRLWLLVM